MLREFAFLSRPTLWLGVGLWEGGCALPSRRQLHRLQLLPANHCVLLILNLASLLLPRHCHLVEPVFPRNPPLADGESTSSPPLTRGDFPQGDPC